MIWLTLSRWSSAKYSTLADFQLPSHNPLYSTQAPFISSTIYTTLWKEEQQKEQKARWRWRWRPQNQKVWQSIQGSQAAPSQPYALKPPSKKHSQLAIVAGREGRIPSKAPQLIELNISFQIFTFFTSFLGAFQFLLFFVLLFFPNFLSSSLAPPSAMATHKLLSYISPLISRFSSPRRTQRLAAPFEFEWKWFYLIFIFLLCSQAFARVHVHVLSSRVAVVPVILVFVAFLIETLNVLHSQQQLGKCICRSLIVLRFHRADMRLSNKISIFFGSFFFIFLRYAKLTGMIYGLCDMCNSEVFIGFFFYVTF